MLASSVAFAEKCQINPENDFSKHHRTRRAPKKYDDNPATACNFDFQTFYRKEFKIVLENFTNCIQDNLQETMSTFKPIQEMFRIPANRSNITIESIQFVVQLEPKFFSEDLDCIFAETQILFDSCKECKSFDDISIVAYKLRKVIPSAYKIVHYIMTAPVTSASCERSFSKLKFVFNDLRTTMGDERLNSLMLLSSSKDKVDEIDLRDVVGKWSMLKHHRVKI